MEAVVVEREEVPVIRSAVVIKKEPHPKQRRALWLLGLDPYHAPPDGVPVNELVFGGMSNGGKSQLIRFVIAIIAELWPGSKVAVFRKTSKDLTKTQIMPFLLEVPEGAGVFNWHHMIYSWKNGSITEFNYCYESDDHLRFKSFEWDVVIFEEATEFPEEQLTFLRSRCKSTRAGWYPIILYATNPGGAGHLFLKRNFVEGNESGERFWGPWEAAAAGLGLIGGDPVRGRGCQHEMEGIPGSGSGRCRKCGGGDFRYRRCFLRSRLADNPSLSPEQAMAGLAGISDPELRRAMAEGDWDLHAGQFFSEFKREVHVVEPFEIPGEWPCWRGFDWGYTAAAACVWMARDPETKRTYVYREWYQERVPTTRQAMIVVNLSRGDPPMRANLGDPSMWRKTKGVGTSEAEEYAAGGIVLTRANNNRHQGFARIHKALAVSEGYGPGLPTRAVELQIFSSCRELIREIANVERAKDDWEDIKEPRNASDLPDHVLDAFRYGLMGAGIVGRDGPVQSRRWDVAVGGEDGPRLSRWEMARKMARKRKT